jgi:hypothetical protein
VLPPLKKVIKATLISGLRQTEFSEKHKLLVCAKMKIKHHTLKHVEFDAQKPTHAPNYKT